MGEMIANILRRRKNHSGNFGDTMDKKSSRDKLNSLRLVSIQEIRTHRETILAAGWETYTILTTHGRFIYDALEDAFYG